MHRRRTQTIMTQQFQKLACHLRHNGFSRIEDIMEFGKIPFPRCTCREMLVNQTEGEIRCPCTGGTISRQPIEPPERILQNSLWAGMDLLASQVDIAEMKRC